MNEKLYKALGASGVSNLVIGTCVLVTGVASGILLIISVAILLKHNSIFFLLSNFCFYTN